MNPFNMVNTRPMKDLILSHLQKVGDISNMEAQAQYRCRALPKRISELKDDGWNIVSRWRTDQTGQRYMRYHFLGRK